MIDDERNRLALVREAFNLASSRQPIQQREGLVLLVEPETTSSVLNHPKLTAGTLQLYKTFIPPVSELLDQRRPMRDQNFVLAVRGLLTMRELAGFMNPLAEAELSGVIDDFIATTLGPVHRERLLQMTGGQSDCLITDHFRSRLVIARGTAANLLAVPQALG